ncbi:MAG: hypothetical protein K2W95_15975 [Candidatus Obscuribacterales bacterium]|nr:hypothetical protein [Candidatus Obscuribacterales bacterium]
MARINVFNVYPQQMPNQPYVDVYCYEPMVTAFGQRTLVSHDVNDYQGDSYRLIADGDEPDHKYGLLEFGWGSCSGCDALQHCASIEELQSLMDHLQDSVKWFADKESLRRYMTEHDWEGDWHWHQEDAHRFREKVMEFLNSDSE